MGLLLPKVREDLTRALLLREVAFAANVLHDVRAALDTLETHMASNPTCEHADSHWAERARLMETLACAVEHLVEISSELQDEN